MKTRKGLGEHVFDTFNILFMCGLMFVTLYPFLYVFFASLSSPMELLGSHGLLFYPKGFQLDGYRMVFMNPMISIGYMNTLMYVIGGTCLNLFMTTLGAYALSRHGTLLRRPASLFIIFTMFFSGGLIPLYLQVQGLHLLDSRWSVIVPTLVSAYNLIIMRTGFESIPPSLEGSARLDGANDFTICFRIILPLSLPVVAVVTLYYAVGHWNSWFNAMIFLKTRDFYPLQLILREILVANVTNNMTTAVESGTKEAMGESIKYSTIIIATLPIICIYPFLQKYFIKGIMIGAVKE